MENFDKYELLTALHKGSVTVTFRKIDTGELRVMPCTLNQTVLEANDVKPSIDYSAKDVEHFALWSYV